MNDSKPIDLVTRITLDGRVYRYTNLCEYIAIPSECAPESPAYVYDTYSLDVVDRLYVLQDNANAAHVILVFKGGELSQALRHINIFNNFSFTMVPAEAHPRIYEEMFSFLLYSSFSEAYVTWLGSLVFRYSQPVEKVTVNSQQIRFGQCDPRCPLLLKNCSKGALFTNLFHPLRSFPNDHEMDMFCSVQREYSAKMASVVLKADSGAGSFDHIRRSIGIYGSQYWLDPLDIFSSPTHSG